MSNAGVDTTPKPRRLSLSQVLEAVLARGSTERSSVTLSRTTAGETTIEVKVRTGDDGATLTVDDAEQKARQVYDKLRREYPTRPAVADADVTLTRNAKGDVQVAVSVSSDPAHLTTPTSVADAAKVAFEDALRTYPLESGYTFNRGEAPR